MVIGKLLSLLAPGLLASVVATNSGTDANVTVSSSGCISLLLQNLVYALERERGEADRP